ncbi:MAG TPA: hypothetical protein VKT52_09225 [Ktedonobacterales bacterium]|nr:hypothetical protein [Ktedonobacterales bacterium]
MDTSTRQTYVSFTAHDISNAGTVRRPQPPLDNRPDQLSGGEQQRVMVAWAQALLAGAAAALRNG